VVPESDDRDPVEGKHEINASTESLPETVVGGVSPVKRKKKIKKKKQTLITMSTDSLPPPEDVQTDSQLEIQLEKQERMRLHVINEIIKTEQGRNYWVFEVTNRLCA
jgi:hypothetical protein